MQIIAGKYQLEKHLGQGATGVVHLATHLSLKRPVALKRLHQPLLKNEGARARFFREARVAASLHHEYAAQVYDFGESDGELYLAMEFIEGMTLRAWLETMHERVAIDEILHLGVQLADVIAAAHEIGLVHRDLKPENVFRTISENGTSRIKLVDFGLAFIAGESGDMGRMTEEGVLGGTPAYMSPEQAQGKQVGPASDIYSLGCILYELLVGGPPFLGGLGELLAMHIFVTPPAPSLRRGRGDVTPALDDLIMSMLKKNPAERPQASHVMRALGELLGQDPASPGTGNTDGAPTPLRVAPVSPVARTRLRAFVAQALPPQAQQQLASLGVDVYELPADITSLAAVVISTPSTPAAQDQALIARGIRIVKIVPYDTAEALVPLMEQGYFDVVGPQAEVSELARKLRRADRMRLAADGTAAPEITSTLPPRTAP